MERFWSKVDKTDSCWNWTACKIKDGYGGFKLNGKMMGAHRASLILNNIELKSGLTVDHLCNNRLCVNPSHLKQVTIKENILRSNGLSAINSRKTHCKRGHEFTSENTYMQKKNQRSCKECQKTHGLLYDQKHRKERAEKARNRWRNKNENTTC